VWVILRRLIPYALELVATNADHWHPDFVMKLWITFHPQVATVPSQQVFIMLAQETSGLVAGPIKSPGPCWPGLCRIGHQTSLYALLL
jgi:hypothetical protein